mmetsp:Transcript_21330/g.35644  ORF Transcript_21330/g.35644 Transcript_21330/m.35644 type:complete len:200 (+) Transcript_21330:272-871(+)
MPSRTPSRKVLRGRTRPFTSVVGSANVNEKPSAALGRSDRRPFLTSKKDSQWSPRPERATKLDLSLYSTFCDVTSSDNLDTFEGPFFSSFLPRKRALVIGSSVFCAVEERLARARRLALYRRSIASESWVMRCWTTSGKAGRSMVTPLRESEDSFVFLAKEGKGKVLRWARINLRLEVMFFAVPSSVLSMIRAETRATI